MTTDAEYELVYCWKCGALLLTRESIQRGIGPVCLKVMQTKYPALTRIFNLDGVSNQKIIVGDG